MSELLEKILAEKKVVVVCGSGGVGKTTTSAALGLYAALAGKRVLVLTIDPARRLANALGLEEFGNLAREVQLQTLGVTPKPGGSLSAMMLDMKQTFDDMVADYSSGVEEQRRIRENRLYKSMSQALAGIQEYMAVAKLYTVLETGAYDLIVLDTPPTSHALDFLDAPQRFVSFLDHDALQWLLKSTSAAGKMGFRLLDIGSSYMMKALGKLAGVDILREIGEFVAGFYPLFLGFKDRAEKISQLMLSPELGFIIVCAPTQPQVDEALFFQRKLQREGLRALAVICNRVHHPLPDFSDAEIAAATLTPELTHAALELAAEHRRLTDSEKVQLERLRKDIASASQVLSAFELTEDIHSLSGLFRLGEQLF